MKVYKCRKCGEPFQPKSGPDYYCSMACRFWSKVRISGKGSCWEWLGTKHGKHYGHFKMGSFVAKAHRIAYELTYGKIPSGLFVCHKCDNPSCCNPRHLWVGTNDDNLKDRQKKERQSRGECHARAKLSEQDVIAIRAQPKVRGVITSLMGKFKVSESTIQQVRYHRTWRHIQ